MESVSVRRLVVALVVGAMVASPLAVRAADDKATHPELSQVRAGVGIVDATWTVGASAGQYASARYGIEDLQNGDPTVVHPDEVLNGTFDPNLHSVKRTPSYGVDSRLSVRAIVVEGPDGTRVALLKSDNYLAQDTVMRRLGQLLTQGNSGVTIDHVLYGVTHNHSSPYYTTPAAGVWLFQDVMDLRMLEYQARAMRDAIETAAADLVPVRMGATSVPYGATPRNAPGAGVADDGSPIGYPHHFNDVGDFTPWPGQQNLSKIAGTGLVVLRFDQLHHDGPPTPLVTWMNWGEHPEDLDGYDLITADYIGPLERMVQRATGAPLVFSQGDVGSSEPLDDTKERLPDGTVRAFSHEGYAQLERKAMEVSNAVLAGWKQIGSGGGTVPYSTDFPVRMADHWFPLPISHPYPSVSNCRTEPTVEGDPGAVLAGLPDCERPSPANDNASNLYQQLQASGIPIPSNYDAPSLGSVEENNRLHLQALRLGDVLLASCACEPQVDLVLNFKSRADNVTGDIWDGFDWSVYCTPSGKADKSWRCANPGKDDLNDRSLVVTDAAYKKMVAEVHNDARGWDSDPTAGAEPADTAAIKGNFTKEELAPARGYKLPVVVGHASDYNGYTVSYRMYMAYDHYRKALTCCGPHSADYMVTRMVRMAGSLNGGPAPGPEPLDGVAAADEARQTAQATVLGQLSSAAYDAWQATLPNDAGAVEPIAQPHNITRFDAATFAWRGGNNDVDNPTVRVERWVNGKWETYADQTGEVQTVLQLPTGVQSELTYRGNAQQWMWTANFEAFDAYPRTFDPRGAGTPDGTYRFVVDGVHRAGGLNHRY
ncbi:MAG: hypothetical protein JOY57_00555, partial [Actinobacteria bacterium]|nr:hypothetical protein [Actinomycetota bacterium]